MSSFITLNKDIVVGEKPLQDSHRVKDIFIQASKYDYTLNYDDQICEKLIKKSITPVKYSSDTLFNNLAKGRPSLFEDYPIPYTHFVDKNNPRQFITNYLSNLDDDFKYRIYRELGSEPVRLTISELIKRWSSDDETLRVTNIHTRKTDIPEVLNFDAVCPFNLLNVNCPDINSLEMMTLMVGTTGSFTDSHSDDADVNNHCIVGKKLWLFWDSLEGVRAGIEDTEKQIVEEGRQALFDLNTFLKLKSAAWCVVGAGQTLFLPGNYAHKVITLEKYLGVGGFFVSYPSMINTYTRWLGRIDDFDYSEPLYRRRNGNEFADYIEFGVIDAARSIGKMISHRNDLRRRWGLDYIKLSLKNWKQNCNDRQLQQDERILQCEELLSSLGAAN